MSCSRRGGNAVLVFTSCSPTEYQTKREHIKLYFTCPKDRVEALRKGYRRAVFRKGLEMLVFWKAKLVLMAVPKTGTTALEEALLPHADAAILNPPQMKHCTVRRYRNQLARFFEQRGSRPLELVAVMREPVDWLSSWYRYRARDAIVGEATSTADLSFDAFVAAWLSENPPEPARVGRQSRFLDHANGTVGVDHLFRHDRMDDLVRFLEARLSVDLTLPARNVSPAGETGLSAEMEGRLRSEAAEDFALWTALCDGRLRHGV